MVILVDWLHWPLFRCVLLASPLAMLDVSHHDDFKLCHSLSALSVHSKPTGLSRTLALSILNITRFLWNISRVSMHLRTGMSSIMLAILALVWTSRILLRIFHWRILADARSTLAAAPSNIKFRMLLSLIYPFNPLQALVFVLRHNLFTDFLTDLASEIALGLFSTFWYFPDFTLLSWLSYLYNCPPWHNFPVRGPSHTTFNFPLFWLWEWLYKVEKDLLSFPDDGHT